MPATTSSNNAAPAPAAAVAGSGAAGGEACIALHGVSFSYQGQPVLVEVDLEVGQRELVSVIGPNGGGKSTMLKLLLGLVRPDRGTVRVFGQEPARVRRRVGYMPQYLHYDRLFPISVLEVALMGRLAARRCGPWRRDDRERARAALDEMGVERLAERQFSSLSGGERQRVLIARALACEPELLLLDEPTANVDPAVEEQLQASLMALGRRMTVLVVSHDLGLVARAFERVICVNRRVQIHPVSALDGRTIEALYGAPRHAVRHDHGHHPEAHTHG